ncbi:MAG: sugar ABC transporter permease [Calditrichales bacterium]|nr:sugar ABC transporter permease [Calditrichales bacterium]
MKTQKEYKKYLLPALILIALVAFFPLLYGFFLSLLRKMPVFKISDFVGLENYIFLFKDVRFHQSVINTVIFTISSVSIEIILGIGIALLMKQNLHGNTFLKAVILIPWVIPTVVSAKMWEWIYNGDFGVLNFLLQWTGIIDNPVNWLGDPHWAMASIIAADIWKTTPFAALLLFAGLQTIPDELYESAKIDGAGAVKQFWFITLPLLLPIILITTIFRMMDALRIFDLVYILTGGGPANLTETLSVYAYKLLFQTLQFGYGSTISIASFFLILLFSSFYIWLLHKRFNYLK